MKPYHVTLCTVGTANETSVLVKAEVILAASAENAKIELMQAFPQCDISDHTLFVKEMF